MNRVVLCLAGVVLLVSAGAAYGASSGYPTVWRLHNHTDQPLNVTCVAAHDPTRPEMKLPPQQIPPRSSQTYQWPSVWYNDGMGLNAASWTCRAGGTSELLRFDSDWGESVVIHLSKGKHRTLLSKGASPKAEVRPRL
jgi:hypothetical protein